jgi:signal transduction histidine kinase
MLIIGVFQIPLTLSELPLLTELERLHLGEARVVSILIAFCFAFWSWRNYASIWLNLFVGIYLMYYTLLGQWYRPLYIGSLMQLSILYAFVFSPPKWIFRSVMVVWLVAYLFVLNLRWARFQEQIQHLQYSDFLFMCLGVWIVAFICHSYFTTDRIFREKALSRFSRIGFQSARLIHDLKGLTAAPKLYSELLKNDLNPTSSLRSQDVLNALSLDLENINRVIVEMNQLSSFKNEAVFTDFHFSEIVQAVQTLLGNRLKGIEIHNSVQLRIKADKGIFTSLVLNLVLNSLESFKIEQTSHPTITFRAEKHKISISDNGGGFSTEVLKGLADRNFVTEKHFGSGLGLWMVLDGMESIGGRAQFSNNDDKGACVLLTFPKRCII